MKRYALVLRLAVLLSVFLLIPDASAQFGGGGGIFGGGRNSAKGGRGGDSQGGNGASRKERQVTPPDASSYEQIEYRLALLEEDLKLKNEQNDAWQPFASKVRAYAGDLARERASGMHTSDVDSSQKTGLQHIAKAVDSAQNRLAALQEVETSARAFYQSLTPEQKILADMRIPTIIAPRPMAPAGSVAGSNMPNPGSDSRPPR